MWKLALVATFIPLIAWSQESGESRRFPSPDKKFEYRVVAEEGVIVDNATGQVVFKIEEATSGTLAVESGKVLWAPDSRRFAFNYRSGGRYYACNIYELAGNEWQVLPDLPEEATVVNDMIKRGELRDRKRLGVSKNASRRRIMDEWKVRRWIDADTVEVFAMSQGSVVIDKKTEDVDYIGGAVLFTVKCDNRGGWKITRTRELSDAELEKMNKEDQDND
ncbi:MAG: hypothetical protein M3119_03490 [Verrucomicrobiota bacterium]|nr:hypothetical protein [Verrucomicrobiota bacterium]